MKARIIFLSLASLDSSTHTFKEGIHAYAITCQLVPKYHELAHIHIIDDKYEI